MIKRIIERLRCATAHPCHSTAHQPSVSDVAGTMINTVNDMVSETVSVAAQNWSVHPAIPELMEMLGIGSVMMPRKDDDHTVSRIQRPDGGYWRIEYTTHADGTLDHLIEIRRNETVALSRLLTQDGILEVDAHIDIPDTIVAGLPGRSLSHLIGVTGAPAHIIIDHVERRTHAQRQPLRVRFERQPYIQPFKQPPEINPCTTT